MRLSLSWLREFIRLPPSPAEVAQLLTEHAFETIVVGPSATLDLRNIRVGEVLDVVKHPNASRLAVVTVGVGGETRRIVCGGPNVRTGIRVAVALPGSEVIGADGARTIIQETTIRDVQSAGMLCSERELGLGTEHGGIIELPPDAPVGGSLARVFPEDILLDADILPNRAADCSSHVGVARELGAILKRRARVPWPSLPRVRGTTSFRLRVEDSRLCSRYIAIVLDGVRLDPSPGWIQRRLRALGVRPQNLIIDVTNYVLWEIGQPTHAFDARAVGNNLTVRVAKNGETITTLDGVDRRVPDGALLIGSETAPLALAGIMGGEASSVRPDTTRVVIESALFDLATIRKTLRELGIRTDAGDRFARGLTASHVEAGAARVVELLTSIMGARVVSVQEVARRSSVVRPILLSHDRIEGVLGMRVRPQVVRAVLKAGGSVVKGTATTTRVTPPPYRADLRIPEDLIEEVGRLVGYDRLPRPLPRAPLVPAVLPPMLQDTRRVQDALKGAGWLEAYTYSFMQEEETVALQLHRVEHLRVVNPLTPDQVRLRVSLLPNLLNHAWAAVKKEPLVKMFEVGRVYPAEGDEQVHIAGVLVRRGEQTATDFYEIKGVVEHLLTELSVPDVWFDATDPTPEETFMRAWEPGVAAEVKSEDSELGFVGAIAPPLLEQLRVQGRVHAFELTLSRIFDLGRTARVYEPPLPYPTVSRDLSLRVPEHVLVDEIEEAVVRAGGAIVQNVGFVDLYDDETGKQKVVTIRITYGSPERTLRDAEVNAFHRKIVSSLQEELGVSERI